VPCTLSPHCNTSVRTTARLPCQCPLQPTALLAHSLLKVQLGWSRSRVMYALVAGRSSSSPIRRPQLTDHPTKMSVAERCDPVKKLPARHSQDQGHCCHHGCSRHQAARTLVLVLVHTAVVGGQSMCRVSSLVSFQMRLELLRRLLPHSAIHLRHAVAPLAFRHPSLVHECVPAPRVQFR
jgi:hypothetical protein